MNIEKAKKILETNKQTYDVLAKEFSETRNFVWTDMNFLLAQINKGDSVLDFGCGNGRLYPELRKDVKYLGIDFSSGLIEEAKKKFPDAEFQVSDILEFNSDKKFNVVISISVLNHFPKEMQDKFVEKAKSLLLPGGKLLLINWNLWNIHRKKSVWRLPHLGGLKNVLTTWESSDQKKKKPLFYYAFTKGEIEKLLTRHGFLVKDNFYCAKGERMKFFNGDNIITIAELK